MSTADILPCGHPTQCLNEDDECDWCEEVGILKASNLFLQEQIEKTAIIIDSVGEVVLPLREPIGLLVMKNGSVTIVPGVTVQ